MKRSAYFLTVIGLLVLFAGCKKQESDADAIRSGINQHLASLKTLNLGAMDMNITNVSVQGNQAQAQVEFKPKTGGAAGRRDASRLLFGKAEWPLGRAKHPAGRRIDPTSRARRKSPYECNFAVVRLHAQLSRSRSRRRKFQCPSARASSHKWPRKFASRNK